MSNKDSRIHKSNSAMVLMENTQVHRLEKSPFIIGRDMEKCDLCLEKNGISLEHAMLIKSADKWYIENLDTSFGVILNGVKLEVAKQYLISRNDRIELGETILMLQLKEDAEKIEHQRKQNLAQKNKKLLIAFGTIFGVLLIFFGVGSAIAQIKRETADIYSKISNEDDVTMEESAAATTPSTTTTETTTPAQVSSNNYSTSWNFANNSGYTYTVTAYLWEPIKSAKIGVQHPADYEDTLSSDSDFDPAKDLVIPGKFRVQNTTSNYSTKIDASAILKNSSNISGGEAIYNGAGTPPTNMDDRITIEEFFTSGPSNKSCSSNNGFDGMGGTRDFGAQWEDMASGSYGSHTFFIIVHDYYSPATPEGDPQLLDWITLRMMDNSLTTDEYIASFKNTDGSTGFYSSTGLTLSGKVVGSTH